MSRHLRGSTEALLASVSSELGVSIAEAAPLQGGDVALSYRLDLGDGRRLFAKTHPQPPPHHFSTEATGLRWMRESGAVNVPEVLAVCDDPPFLALEWIVEGRPERHTEPDLGRALASLHRVGAKSFGRSDRRSTGSRGLPNELCDTWAEFYCTQRLLPLARLARDGAALSSSSVADLESVARRLAELGGEPEPPALLHGDLWAGNRLIDADGRSWLIDPAVHCGHREFDLAMMRLFGGFGAECFAAYDEAFPLQRGWQDRVPLHQLAPLVVHAIKFGGGYAAATEAALAHYR
jgi:fructosamine-3-kinase